MIKHDIELSDWEGSFLWSYDSAAKAGYLKLRNGQVKTTTLLNDNVFMDRDKEGVVIGIEILNI